MQANSLNVNTKKSLQNLALTFANLRQNSLKKTPNFLTVTSLPIFFLIFHFAVPLLILRSPFYELFYYVFSFGKAFIFVDYVPIVSLWVGFEKYTYS